MAANGLNLGGLPASRKRKEPERYDPATADSVVTTHDLSADDSGDVVSAKKRMRQAAADAPFNATASLRMSGEICLIETARMASRSKHEVWNYAFLTNKYLDGKRKKVKSTKKYRDKQTIFCGGVRSWNRQMFDNLNDGKAPGDKMFSVVGHVPDQAISGDHGFQASCGPDGMYQVPGWLPMSRQANGLVANLSKQTESYVKELWVDGIKPNCLIQVDY